MQRYNTSRRHLCMLILFWGRGSWLYSGCGCVCSQLLDVDVEHLGPAAVMQIYDHV